jgi:hypothetical protein
MDAVAADLVCAWDFPEPPTDRITVTAAAMIRIRAESDSRAFM